MASNKGTATGRFRIEIHDSQVRDFISRATREAKNASKRAARAALAVIREEAARRAVGRWRQPNKGFRTSVDMLVQFVLRGKLVSASPGNIVEVGARAHNAPIDKHFRRWLLRHGFGRLLELPGLMVSRGGRRWFVPFKDNPRLRRWAVQHTKKGSGGEMVPLLRRTYLPVKQQSARPFVIPAAQTMETAAAEAFKDVILNAILEA